MDDLSVSRWYEVERDMELLARWAPLIEGSSEAEIAMPKRLTGSV